MSSEFREKLNLYKDGKLNQNEIAEIECELDKFITISEYLNDDDEAFLKELKQQMTPNNINETRPSKVLKRRVNLRIIIITTITVFLASISIILLIFLTSKITTSLFGLNYKKSFVQRQIIMQISQILNPEYTITECSSQNSLYAQQNIDVHLNTTVGNTKIDETEINIKYSFGKPVKSDIEDKLPLMIENYALLFEHEANTLTGFEPLEKAPEGTKAKIFVEFNKTLTVQQLKENFIDRLNNVDTEPLEITPVVNIGSKFVLANPSYYQFRPVYPFDSDNAKLLEDNPAKQIQYENMDNQAHEDSLIGNLNLLKDNQKLVQIMSYTDMFEVINIDDIIKDVKNNGAEYVGMHISADREELLKLKGNSLIHCVSVENIVVW